MRTAVMISALSWVAKGAAAAEPVRVEVETEEEMQLLQAKAAAEMVKARVGARGGGCRNGAVGLMGGLLWPSWTVPCSLWYSCGGCVKESCVCL